MNLLTIVFAFCFIILGNVAYAAKDFSLSANCDVGVMPLSVTTTVEKHTAKYHIFSEKINMIAHVGELWQANDDVLYQTNNHDVTDLAKGEDGRYVMIMCHGFRPWLYGMWMARGAAGGGNQRAARYGSSFQFLPGVPNCLCWWTS